MPAPAVILTISRMHAAIDPEGVLVWCDYANREAHTNANFCQYCGNPNHEEIKGEK